MEWKNTDPREDIYARDIIVILIPSDKTSYQTTIGYVETKHGYYIDAPGYKEHSFIDADEKWPEHWLWIRGPEKG